MVIKESLSAERYIEVFMNEIIYLQLASRYFEGEEGKASICYAILSTFTYV